MVLYLCVVTIIIKIQQKSLLMLQKLIQILLEYNIKHLSLFFHKYLMLDFFLPSLNRDEYYKSVSLLIQFFLYNIFISFLIQKMFKFMQFCMFVLIFYFSALYHIIKLFLMRYHDLFFHFFHDKVILFLNVIIKDK